MKTSVLSFVLLSSALLITGCASLPDRTPVDCTMPNWHEIGMADGQAGLYPYQISRHQKRCPSISIDNDVIKTWEAGRQLGLKQYCTKANAYLVGQRGLPLNQVCPEEGLLEIQQAHALGYQQYYQQTQLENFWRDSFYRPWSPFYWW